MKPDITAEKLTTEYESEFMNVYEYPFGTNGHYYTASRRKADNLVMLHSEQEYKNMLPDAVTMAVIINDNNEPKLLMNYEFRYALGEYVLAPPAGLIDNEDKETDNPIITTAIREIQEETGLVIKNTDSVFEVNHLLFSSPGMTDESNAIVCALIKNPDMDALSHEGELGAENFDGFELITLDEAKNLIRNGRDKHGRFYSVYTYICLMYFASMAWCEN